MIVEGEEHIFPLVPDGFVMEFESLQDPEVANISDWSWQAQALFPMCVECSTGDGTGEAFAYAESTSAVDLNGDEMMAAGDII